MSTPNRRTPLVEAQSLLDEHGSWMAAAGAYWESDDIGVLVQPASFDDPMDPRTPDDTVDVVFTVVSASQPLAFGGITLELESLTGIARTATLDSRGQATLRELPLGTWRARLTEPATAGSGEAVAEFPIARRSIFRQMAAAAGEPEQPVPATLASDDGLIRAEFVETGEGRLEVTLTTATAREPLPMARLTWVCEMVGEAHENILVTPFAEVLKASLRDSGKANQPQGKANHAGPTSRAHGPPPTPWGVGLG
jgi:hypothetical protein